MWPETGETAVRHKVDQIIVGLLTRDVLWDAIPIADVVQTPPRPALVAHEGDLVDQRAHAKPGADLDRAALEQDVLAQAEAELLLQEHPGGGHVRGQEVEVVEPPHRHAVQWPLLRAVEQWALLLSWRLVVRDLPEQLHRVSGGRGEAIGRAMAAVALTPAEAQATTFDRRDPLFQRLGGGRTPSDMAQARLGGFGQLEGVMVEVFVRAQVD